MTLLFLLFFYFFFLRRLVLSSVLPLRSVTTMAFLWNENDDEERGEPATTTITNV
jgi:hypothetical protein